MLTSDMAYVINGGEKPTIRFQLFVDLCCQAYNLIRKHASLFLNLLSLVIIFQIQLELDRSVMLDALNAVLFMLQKLLMHAFKNQEHQMYCLGRLYLEFSLSFFYYLPVS